MIDGGIFWRGTRTVEGGVVLGITLQLVEIKSKPRSKQHRTAILTRLEYPEHEIPEVENLATRFSDILKAWLVDPYITRRHGPNLFDRMRQKNRDDASYLTGMTCHSHDFVDANMTMSEAFELALGREPIINDLGGPDDVGLWNEAWFTAKRRGFERTSPRLIDIKAWMENPLFGNDTGSGKLLKPTQTELEQILVALDYFMETGKELTR